MFKSFIDIVKNMCRSLVEPEYKSTLAAHIAYTELKNKKKVWSNFPIKGCMALSPKDDLGVYMVDGGTVLLDEIGIDYNNRDFKSFPKTSLEWFKLYRHNRCHVHVFSQSWEDMDKKIRLLSTKYYVCKKSLIPFLYARTRYVKNVGVKKETQEFGEIFDKVPFSTRYIFAPKYWSMFDSFERKELPQKEWSVW
jgi:hypothetical protein